MAHENSPIDDLVKRAIDLIRRLLEQPADGDDALDRKAAHDELLWYLLLPLVGHFVERWFKENGYDSVPDDVADRIALNIAVRIAMNVCKRRFRLDKGAGGLVNYIKTCREHDCWKWARTSGQRTVSLDELKGGDTRNGTTAAWEPGDDTWRISVLMDEQKEAVWDVIESLSGRDSWIFVRRFVNERIFQEIADERGIGLATAHERVRQARENFFKAWRDKYGEWPGRSP